MKEIAPSLLAADFYNLEKQIEELNQTRVKYLHLDVMDGNFVPNISFGPAIIKQLREKTDMIFDTHLMIMNPEKYIDDFVDAGSDIISFHPEATMHPHTVISKIKSHGRKAGIVLNPNTDENVLKYLIKDIDLVLIMSVVPGFGGQKFMPLVFDKIERVKKIIAENNPDVILEIDGGIKLHNVKEVADAGVELLVAGSAVFNQDGISKNIEDFYRELGLWKKL